MHIVTGLAKATSVSATQNSSAYMGWADMLSVLSMTPMQDSPKSVSLTWPWLEISRLSGFRSRWMMACKYDTGRLSNSCRMLVIMMHPHVQGMLIASVC